MHELFIYAVYKQIHKAIVVSSLLKNLNVFDIAKLFLVLNYHNRESHIFALSMSF